MMENMFLDIYLDTLSGSSSSKRVQRAILILIAKE